MKTLSKWNYKFATENPVYFAHLLIAYYQNMLQTTVEEERFVSEKLSVPTPLPRILKEFTKGAIRTQPYDLLRWSVAYFTALAHGEEPPVKDRLEFPPPLESVSGLTPGYLRVLHRQLGTARSENGEVEVELLNRRWCELSLKESSLKEILELLDSPCDVVVWIRFVALASAYISQSPLQTMVQVCETLTSEPEGASACIPLATFETLYQLISDLDVPAVPGIGAAFPRDSQLLLLEYVRGVAEEQGNNVTPRNLAHFACPKSY